MVKHLENGVAEHAKEYEWKTASVNVAGTDATTNIRTIAGFTTLFDTVKRAHRITVEASGAAYIRLNTATADKITLGATTPYTNDYCVADALFISTNGGAITITVKLS